VTGKVFGPKNDQILFSVSQRSFSSSKLLVNPRYLGVLKTALAIACTFSLFKTGFPVSPEAGLVRKMLITTKH
jgi:hypothetical protein